MREAKTASAAWRARASAPSCGSASSAAAASRRRRQRDATSAAHGCAAEAVRRDRGRDRSERLDRRFDALLVGRDRLEIDGRGLVGAGRASAR